ncbi:MAG: cation transporter [Reyranella sp.]|nr:cation transporter [Reyranella sp.]
MDCSDCASTIERTARDVAGIRDARVSLAAQEMTLRLAGPNAGPLAELEQKIAGLGYRLARLDAEGDREQGPRLSHLSRGYRRALWIVVLLNAGYGLIEFVGGFVAASQSLKADALDFIGDGLISLLGLVAIRWGAKARAGTALLQGVFLAALGIGVLLATAYRVFVLRQPEAELMGIFGAIGLIVNLTAAAVLVPHRHGDANVRAIWLFSRNDAIANVAVVVAAALVAWTRTPWPDLGVAMVIAGLFLHSAYAIIVDARRELAAARRSFPQDEAG